MECAASCGVFSLNNKSNLRHKQCIRKKVTFLSAIFIHILIIIKKIHTKIVRVGRNSHSFDMHNHIYDKHFEFLVVITNEMFAIVVKEGLL